MTDKQCSFEDCEKEPVTSLQIEDEEVPGCNQHLDQLAKGQTQPENNGPYQKLKSGSVHLDIWKNEDQPDNYSFKRFYTENDGDTVEETRNMGPRDLSDIKTLIQKAQLQEVEEK